MFNAVLGNGKKDYFKTDKKGEYGPLPQARDRKLQAPPRGEKAGYFWPRKAILYGYTKRNVYENIRRYSR